jgi:hypothetical protein
MSIYGIYLSIIFNSNTLLEFFSLNPVKILKNPVFFFKKKIINIFKDSNSDQHLNLCNFLFLEKNMVILRILTRFNGKLYYMNVEIEKKKKKKKKKLKDGYPKI